MAEEEAGPDPLEEVHACLTICGLGANGTRFTENHGIMSLDDIGRFQVKDVKELIDQYNGRRSRQQAHRLGGTHLNNLRALVYWIRDPKHRQLTYTLAE